MTDARDDLVERPRAYGGNNQNDYRHQAATRIQQLTARVDELERERDEARSQRREWQTASALDRAKCQAAEASLAEAERVMEPFARAAALLNFAGATHSDEVELTGDELHKALRAARAWLDSRRALQEGKSG